MEPCPKCGWFAEPDGACCARCGVVFARWRTRAARVEAEADVPEREPALPGATAERAEPVVDRMGWQAFGGGLVVAVLALQFSLARAALGGLTTLVHEMGHAAFGWLFGYPSVPAFDFTYGGGVTLQHQRSFGLSALSVGAAALGLYALRARAALRSALLGVLSVYALLALTRGHQALILAMGHGGELGFATLALHRALSGRGCKLEAERPLYGLVGWFLVLSGGGFGWRLRTSALHRELYGAAKGGGHWMDFSRLASEFLHVSLESVATAFIVLCRLPPVVALWLQCVRRR